MALHHKPVLVLDVQHLFIHFLHGHLASEHCCYGEITAMPGITSSHHVLAIKHLLGQFRYSKGTVLLWTATGQRCKPWHEEMKAGEWDHVDRQLPQVSIQLKWAQGYKFYLLKTWMINRWYALLKTWITSYQEKLKPREWNPANWPTWNNATSIWCSSPSKTLSLTGRASGHIGQFPGFDFCRDGRGGSDFFSLVPGLQFSLRIIRGAGMLQWSTSAE